MDARVQDVLQMTLNLSQAESPELMWSQFLETMNGLLPGVELTRVAAKETALGEVLDVTTSRGVYGHVAVVGSSDSPPEHMTLVVNAVRMLAIMLENLQRKHALTDDQNRLKATVDLRTAELLDLNRRLEQEVEQRRRAQIEARALNAELVQHVEDRADILEALASEKEARSYSVSHDLRAPLRIIDGFSKILIEEHAHQLDADGRDLLERLQRATQRMSKMINGLLQLSRLSRRSLQREDVDLTSLAKDILNELRRDHDSRTVTVNIADGMQCNGDRELLRQALRHLLGNAWKFTERNPTAVIEVGHVLVDDQEAFFIKDDGIGFDMINAQRLFGPFQRLHRETEYKGSGIGLATVRGIVHRHGGRAWAESSPGKGATFYFTIPTRPIKSASQSREHDAVSPLGPQAGDR